MESKKQKILFLPKPNLTHLLFLLYFLITICKKYTKSLLPKNKKFIKEFYELFLNLFGDYLSLIPYLIIKIRSKGNKHDFDKENQDAIQYIYTDVEKKLKLKGSTIKKIFIYTFGDFLAQVSFLIFYTILSEENIEEKFVNFNSTLIINVIAMFLLSHLVLHTNFHRHHYFTLLLNIICLIVLIIIDIYEMVKNSKQIGYQIINIAISIFRIILYTIVDVLIKVLFLYNYFSSFSILLIKSICLSFYLIIFLIPFIFIQLKDPEGEKATIFTMLLRNFDDKINILYAILYSAISFIFNITLYKIIEEFSPNHFVIARFYENFATIITNIILNGVDSEKYLALRIIMYVILTFASLIFNEFIVINICGLSKDTQLFLNYEAEKELSMIDKDNLNYRERNSFSSDKGRSSELELFSSDKVRQLSEVESNYNDKERISSDL